MTTVVPSLTQQIRHPRCPRCGNGKLFADMLGIVDACSECGLVLKHHDAADAPTFFALVIVGLGVTVGAALVEINYEPAMWVHAALWIPLTFIGSIVCLRSFKTIFITIEHRLKQLKQEDPNA
jgi:uncharacterized protein (DUF983 family)